MNILIQTNTHTDKHVNKLKLMNILIQTKYTHRQTCEQTQAHEYSNPDKIHTQTNM